MPRAKQHGAIVEVAKDLVQRKQSEITDENRGEKAIALDLARRAALLQVGFDIAAVSGPSIDVAISM